MLATIFKAREELSDYLCKPLFYIQRDFKLIVMWLKLEVKPELES